VQHPSPHDADSPRAVAPYRSRTLSRMVSEDDSASFVSMQVMKRATHGYAT
jgi:hypothetical protein